MLNREQSDIGPAWWKIPFHLTYEDFGNSNQNFCRVERAQYLSLVPIDNQLVTYKLINRLLLHLNFLKNLKRERVIHRNVIFLKQVNYPQTAISRLKTCYSVKFELSSNNFRGNLIRISLLIAQNSLEVASQNWQTVLLFSNSTVYQLYNYIQSTEVFFKAAHKKGSFWTELLKVYRGSDDGVPVLGNAQ